MNASEHIKEAEKLLERADDDDLDTRIVTALATMALAHAQIATAERTELRETLARRGW